MLLKVIQCFTDHITVIMEGVQDGSWDGLGGVRRSVKGIKLGRVCVHLRTKEQGGAWVEVMGVLGSVKSREGCGGVQLTGEWMAPVTGSNLITSCSPALPLKHTMPEQDHGNSH